MRKKGFIEIAVKVIVAALTAFLKLTLNPVEPKKLCLFLTRGCQMPQKATVRIVPIDGAADGDNTVYVG